ncbi:MAG: leucyl aminopeptidase [Proteobacteria bacterium]|nr:leucyl aminopeptidase [Pseudomonadota bacterium]NCA27997.1 leucyl aminopeptidase [Pseudomonadota bacterium]
MQVNFINVADNLGAKNYSGPKNSGLKKSLTTSSKNNSLSIFLISSDYFKKNNTSEFKSLKQSFDFEAKFLQTVIIPIENSVSLYFGIGEISKLNDVKFNKIGARILATANSMKYDSVNVYLQDHDSASDLVNIAFGALLQSYRFNKYFEKKLKDKNVKIKDINFFTKHNENCQKIFGDLDILAKNIFFVRDLVSEPSNVLNPESYAKICQNIKIKGLEIEVLGEKDMAKLGMNSLLGVGVGSAKESKLVVLKWFGGKKGEQPLAFVGKGVTFDTGGISIKPSNNMEDMKTDMAGSAVVVGLMQNLAQRKAKVNAVGVIGLVENMPSGTAQRPGDVVKSMSGQTIEVINTDAEGRLVLADALHYTNTKFKPKLIVDLATLTGAIIVALADVYAGLFCNDDELAKQLEKCGNATGERVWRLPLGDEYDDMINSDIADMKNVGSGRGAGSITAAQFLQRFVGSTKWAHLDIAGVAWKGKGDALAHKGATGFGVRLLNEFVKKFEK